jgi:hypothetical protein
MAIFNKN